MQSLSPEARARLAEFQRAESPAPETEDRVLAALERRLAEPAPRRRVVVPLVTALALAAALLLVVRWAIAPAGRADEAAVQAPYHDEPRTTGTVHEAPAVVTPVVTPVAPELVPAPEAAAVAEPPVPSASSPRRPRAASADDIAAEVALLRAAKLAAPARRLELLGEHARRFPGGSFAAERSLLEVEARCELGEVDEARALAARFAQRFPASPLAARVAKICDD